MKTTREKGIILCGFPGSGKTHLGLKYKNIIDLGKTENDKKH